MEHFGAAIYRPWRQSAGPQCPIYGPWRWKWWSPEGLANPPAARGPGARGRRAASATEQSLLYETEWCGGYATEPSQMADGATLVIVTDLPTGELWNCELNTQGNCVLNTLLDLCVASLHRVRANRNQSNL